MAESSSGYPKKSSIAINLERNPSNFQHYFQACLKYLNWCLEPAKTMSSIEFLQQQEMKDTHQNDEYSTQILKIMNGKLSLSYLSLVDITDTEIKLAEIANVAKLQSESPLRIVFAFDEVRELLKVNHLGQMGQTAFAELRRASQILPESMGIALALMDTTSYISNMAPSKGAFPSDKVKHQSCKLFDPIYLLPSMDIGAINPINNRMEDVLSLEVVYRYGRPMWAAFLQNQFTASNHLSN
jgi:hypothetical protein